MAIETASLTAPFSPTDRIAAGAGPSSGTAVVRVLLVEDHEVVRAGLRILLESTGEFHICGEAAGVSDGIAAAQSTRPDMAVIDVNLIDGTGIALCRELRHLFPGLPCVILTSATDDHTLLDAIDAGAVGFLLKRVDQDALMRGLRTVAKGGSLIDPAMTGQLLARIREGDLDGIDPRVRELTERQRELLSLLGEGLTNREIADRLYLSEKTIRNYVSDLLSRLGMTNRTEAAVFAARLRQRP